MLHGYLPQLLAGAWLTLQLATNALMVGLVLTVLGALALNARNRFLHYSAFSLTTLIRGLPELLVLFTVYFGTEILLYKLFNQPVEISNFWAGVLALGIIFGAYGAQVFQQALYTIPRGQQEAATALGLTKWQCYKSIILPQAWRHALPSLGNLTLILIKDTALVSLIGLTDLMSRAQAAASQTQKPFTFYFAVAIIYLVLTAIVELGLHKAERHANRHLRKTP